MEEKIFDLLNGVLKNNGYILSNVIYEQEENTNFLRIVIDKEGYININDCVLVNELINPILDEADLIEESYILDVCSKEKGSE
ncbi:MAG: hypothetical protein KIC82_03010 [Acholeplasma sp.]|nr:hypothetical protein [Acholeplasma sp.]